MRGALLSVSVVLLAGCGSPSGSSIPAQEGAPQLVSSSAASSPAASSPAASATVKGRGSSLADQVGKCVRAKGYAAGAKIGPVLLVGSDELWVSPQGGEEAWHRLPSGSLVEVRGIVRERRDLPVFVQKAGEPIMQGMPVPEGTDLEAARKRLVIEDAAVAPLRSKEQVERELKPSVGTTVALSGVVWSRNDMWWFNYDGVVIYLEGRDRVSGFGSLHGKGITLHGKLERKKMRSIDFIQLGTPPEFEERFVLSLEKSSPHPGFPLEPCNDD